MTISKGRLAQLREVAENAVQESNVFSVPVALMLLDEIELGRAEVRRAMIILTPNMPKSGLIDACKQVKQAAISEADNARRLEAEVERLSPRACPSCAHPLSEHEEADCWCDRGYPEQNGCRAHSTPTNKPCKHKHCGCPNIGGRMNPYNRDAKGYIR